MWVKNKIFNLAIMILVIATFTGCTSKIEKVQTDEPKAAQEEKAAEQPAASKEKQGTEDIGSIILATTTSTENSGLLDYLLPLFKEETGIEVKVIAVGTGKALQMGMDGEADVLLVHAKSSEEKFIEEGHGKERFDVMYNDFVVIGPKNQENSSLENVKNNAVEGFKILGDRNSKFISRGDDSGTHKKELEIWKKAGIEPKGDWYVSAGKGMGDVIQMANEMLGYTLADRATYLSMKDNIDLGIVIEGDTQLFNQYGVIAVNPDKNDKINSEGAQAFLKWILSEQGQKYIGEFGKDKFGESLFIPNAK